MLRCVVMTVRAIASATVSFGLVSIPVKVYSSGDTSTGVRFNMLHRKCGSRLKQQYICSKGGEKVERSEMVKGFEFSKGKYVQFTDDEVKRLQEKATQTVEITEFLPTETIDPLYYENCYYLGPDKGGDRAYRLLARALKKSGRSALAKYAARGKQYLVLVRPVHDALVMQQLRYPDEIRKITEIPLGEATVKDAELKLALQIVDQGAAEVFRPESYQDDVKARMMAEIQNKVEGREITEEPSDAPQSQVIDLMEALKKSLAKKVGSRRPSARAGTGAKKTAKRAKS